MPDEVMRKVGPVSERILLVLSWRKIRESREVKYVRFWSQM